MKGPPTRRPLALKLPLLSVEVRDTVPDGMCVTMTAALATGPLADSTVPRTDDEVSCAATGAASTALMLIAAALAAR